MSNYSKKRKYLKEINSLKTKLTISRIYSVLISITCIGLGFMYMNNNNKLVSNNIDTVMAYEQSIQDLKETMNGVQSNYDYLKTKYSSMLDTINELTLISTRLDEENKALTESNEAYYKDLCEFKQRKELYDKYEYAIIDLDGKRTDITYEQLDKLEDLVAKSNIPNEDLILAWIMTESNGQEKARNMYSTAKGYGQILDGTSRFVYTTLLNKTNWNSNVALDGNMNLEMMVAYIDYLYDRNNGNLYEIIRDYRGRQDVTNYITRIDEYLKGTGQTVAQIAKDMKPQS